jgi:hypothetical protein
MQNTVSDEEGASNLNRNGNIEQVADQEDEEEGEYDEEIGEEEEDNN